MHAGLIYSISPAELANLVATVAACYFRNEYGICWSEGRVLNTTFWLQVPTKTKRTKAIEQCNIRPEFIWLCRHKERFCGQPQNHKHERNVTDATRMSCCCCCETRNFGSKKSSFLLPCFKKRNNAQVKFTPLKTAHRFRRKYRSEYVMLWIRWF